MSDNTLTLRMFNAQQGYQAIQAAWMHAKPLLVAAHTLHLEIRPETRSTQQNRLLHALIGDVARQVQWLGKHRTPAEWKVLLVSGHSVATKQGAEMVPGLEGEFVNIRESTARMSRARVASLIDYIEAFGTLHGVTRLDALQWTVDADTGEMVLAS